jgi:hypothetical protein
MSIFLIVLVIAVGLFAIGRYGRSRGRRGSR